jgi:hypothetical protein
MKVEVTSTVTIAATATANVHYEAGFKGTAPRDHITRIEAAGAGRRFGTLLDGSPAGEPEPLAGAADEGSPA